MVEAHYDYLEHASPELPIDLLEEAGAIARETGLERGAVRQALEAHHRFLESSELS